MDKSGISFEQWLVNLGKSTKTARNYAQAVYGSISQWAIEDGLTTDSIVNLRHTPTNFKVLADGIRQLEIFKERDAKGKGMYKAALKNYLDYIDDLTGLAITEDINDIVLDKSISLTEKTTLISTRIGQGQFRQRLIDYWQGCAITGFPNTRLLVASHIKPWRISNNIERLDVNNGLLLLPNLDKAFDLGYISFEENGKVCISQELDRPDVLGIDSQLKLNVTFAHQEYLVYHRENVFKH